MKRWGLPLLAIAVVAVLGVSLHRRSQASALPPSALLAPATVVASSPVVKSRRLAARVAVAPTVAPETTAPTYADRAADAINYMTTARPLRQEWIAASCAKVGLSAEKTAALQRYENISFEQSLTIWRTNHDTRTANELARGLGAAYTAAVADLLGQADWIRFQAAMQAAQAGTLDELDLSTVRTNYGPNEGEAVGLPTPSGPAFRPLFK